MPGQLPPLVWRRLRLPREIPWSCFSILPQVTLATNVTVCIILMQALMTTNRRTPLDQFLRQTLPEATRADAAELLDALWKELAVKQEQQSGTANCMMSAARHSV